MSTREEMIAEGEERERDLAEGWVPGASNTQAIVSPKPRKHKPRGFACISLKRRREIASLGGKASQALGKVHKFTHEEAVEAGRLAQARRKGGSNKK